MDPRTLQGFQTCLRELFPIFMLLAWSDWVAKVVCITALLFSSCICLILVILMLVFYCRSDFWMLSQIPQSVSPFTGPVDPVSLNTDQGKDDESREQQRSRSGQNQTCVEQHRITNITIHVQHAEQMVIGSENNLTSGNLYSSRFQEEQTGQEHGAVSLQENLTEGGSSTTRFTAE